ncbi:MAG: hypothetical protein CMD43_01150 [Gammaproteobacteria bacterium]|jgi:hypothetical protein|nr:hypothetical protein [Gammaproteobacteria bacterium]|tara:strand:+ start:51 stop:245 length:195 start_codon:yes stop_codon:yes gene_type:complete
MKLTLQEIVDKLRDIEGSVSNAYHTTPEYKANSDGLYYMNEADTLISKLLSEVEKLNKQGHTII